MHSFSDFAATPYHCLSDTRPTKNAIDVWSHVDSEVNGSVVAIEIGIAFIAVSLKYINESEGYS